MPALPGEPTRRGGAAYYGTAEACGSDVIAYDSGSHIVPCGQHKLLFEAISTVERNGVVLSVSYKRSALQLTFATLNSLRSCEIWLS